MQLLSSFRPHRVRINPGRADACIAFVVQFTGFFAHAIRDGLLLLEVSRGFPPLSPCYFPTKTCIRNTGIRSRSCSFDTRKRHRPRVSPVSHACLILAEYGVFVETLRQCYSLLCLLLRLPVRPLSELPASRALGHSVPRAISMGRFDA